MVHARFQQLLIGTIFIQSGESMSINIPVSNFIHSCLMENFAGVNLFMLKWELEYSSTILSIKKGKQSKKCISPMRLEFHKCDLPIGLDIESVVLDTLSYWSHSDLRYNRALKVKNR